MGYYEPVDDSNITLTLTWKAKRNKTIAKIEDTTAIAKLARLIVDHQEEINERELLDSFGDSFSSDKEKPPVELMAATFNDYMRKFLDLCKAEKNKCSSKSKYQVISVDKSLFIGRLAYLTKISDNSKLQNKEIDNKYGSVAERQDTFNNIVKNCKKLHRQGNVYYF